MLHGPLCELHLPTRRRRFPSPESAAADAYCYVRMCTCKHFLELNWQGNKYLQWHCAYRAVLTNQLLAMTKMKHIHFYRR